MKNVNGKVNGLNLRLLEGLQATAAHLGITIQVNSGYRSIEEQRRLYEGYKKGLPGYNLAAPPGRSNHNFRTAADIRPHLGTSKAHLAVARRYGIVFPVRGEPWHAEPEGASTSKVRSGPHYKGGAVPLSRWPQKGTTDTAATKKWQQQLNAVTKAGLKVDGVFGDATHAATVAFQTKHGLTADGIVGPQTTGKMQQVAAGGPPPTPKEVAVAVVAEGKVDRDIATPMARTANLALLKPDHLEVVRHAYIIGKAASTHANRASYDSAALLAGPTRTETAALVQRWIEAYTKAGRPQLRSLKFVDDATKAPA